MVRKRLSHAALAVHGVLHRDAVNHGLVARLQSPVEARVKTIVAGSGRYTGHQDHELRCGADVARKQRSEEHTSELQSLAYLVCRLLLEKKKNKLTTHRT